MAVVELLVDNSVVEVLPTAVAEVVEVLTPNISSVIEIINTGPQGPSGSGGTGDVTIAVLAAEDLAPYIMVTVQGNVANSNNVAHYNKVMGITTEETLTGSIAQLVADTEVTNDLWTWSPGAKLFLNGTSISATPPSSGFSQLVAVARNANIIIMRLEPPILL